MHLTKILLALPLAIGLWACGDDSSASAGVDDPGLNTESSASSGPLNTDPGSVPTVPDPSTPASSAAAVGPVTGAVALPAGASNVNSEMQYQNWKARWIMTLSQEVAGGSTLDYSMYTGDRAQVLLTQKMGMFHSNPARVVWDGGSATQCDLDGMTSWGDKSLTAGLRKKLGCTVSEGIGYGMLIAVLHNDQELYNALWAYNIIARDYNNFGLMPWELQSFSRTISTSAALDADLDVAASLIMAASKWSNMADFYLNDARALIASVYSKGVNLENNLIRPGDTWANKDVYNLSYFAPASLRLFAAVDNVSGADWNAIIKANYDYMIKVQNGGAATGLFPDWSNAAGEATDPNNGSAANSYMLFDKESVRIPWRMAWDYYWNQDANALAVLSKMAAFITAQTNYDPNAISSKSYNYLTGVLSDSDIIGTHYTGMYCLMGMGVDQKWLDACYQKFSFDVANAQTVGYSGTYFKEILTMLFSSLMNGDFVKPF